MRSQFRLNQLCQQRRCTNSSGIVHVSSSFLTRPEFLVHSAMDIIDIEDMDMPNLGLLPDMNQTVR